MQEYMPHFIIGDDFKITNVQMAALHRSACPNVHIWRNRQKAWNNHSLMLRILAKISEAVSSRTDLQPVLILDVAQCHIHQSVLQRARSLGIWLVFVPASVICLLQPLDTHGFASFKAWLRHQYILLRGQAKDGLVDRLAWVRVLQRAQAAFFAKKQWADSFRETGATLSHPPCLTHSLSKIASPSAAWTASAQQPTAQMLSLVWPRNRRLANAQDALFQPKPDDPSPVLPRPASAKRPPVELAVSIAMSSRQNKRACRQYPCRSE